MLYTRSLFTVVLVLVFFCINPRGLAESAPQANEHQAAIARALSESLAEPVEAPPPDPEEPVIVEYDHTTHDIHVYEPVAYGTPGLSIGLSAVGLVLGFVPGCPWCEVAALILEAAALAIDLSNDNVGGSELLGTGSLVTSVGGSRLRIVSGALSVGSIATSDDLLPAPRGKRLKKIITEDRFTFTDSQRSQIEEIAISVQIEVEGEQ